MIVAIQTSDTAAGAGTARAISNDERAGALWSSLPHCFVLAWEPTRALLPPKRPSGFPSHTRKERHWKLPSTNPTTPTTSARRTSDVPKQSSCSNARRKQPRSTRPRKGYCVSQTRSPEAPRTGQGLSSHGRGPMRHDVPRSRRRGRDSRGRTVVRRHGGRAARARPLHVYESCEHSRYRKQSSE